MALKHPARTPSQAMRLVDMEMTFSKRKAPKSAMQPPAQPALHAKRLVDIFAEMFPPTNRQQNTTSVKKTMKPINQIQKSYLSTSKKQIQSRKTDHTIVRRALNFIATSQVDEIQVHPRSKKITRQTLAPTKVLKEKDNNSLKGIVKFNSVNPLHKQIDKASKMEPPIKKMTDAGVTEENRRATVAHSNRHTYELRSRSTLDQAVTQDRMFTQYRNVNESFDVSTYEESSPQINPTEKSIFEPIEKLETNSVDTQLSDILSEMLGKTELTPDNSSISTKAAQIQSKTREFVLSLQDQMKSLDLVYDQVLKAKQMLLNNLELANRMTEMSEEFIKLVNNDINSKKNTSSLVSMDTLGKVNIKKKHQEPPVNKNCPLEKIQPGENPSKPFGNLNTYNPIIAKFEKSPVVKKSPKLNKLHNSVKKENISPLRKNIHSPKASRSQSLRDDLLKYVLKSNVRQTDNIKTADVTSPRNSKKSQQIFKSLKDSVNFLKTPVGKGNKIGSSLVLDTPNTRSRNITSNNIKRQLESLYDD